MNGVIACRIFILIVTSQKAQAGDDPLELQNRAMSRIDHCIETLHKTGDAACYQPDLNTELSVAFMELQKSYEQLIDKGERAPASLSLVRMGDIRRLQRRWEDAHSEFSRALSLAQQAGSLESQARAVLGISRVEYFSVFDLVQAARRREPMMKPIGDYSTAVDHAREAQRLSENLPDKRWLFDALENEAMAQKENGKLDTAEEILRRALAIAKKIADPYRNYISLVDMGDVAQVRADPCSKQDFTGSYSECYASFNQATSNFQQAAGIALKFGFNHLGNAAEGLVQSAKTQKCLVENQECLRKASLRNATGPIDLKPGQSPEDWADQQYKGLMQQCNKAC